jgi:glycosyltransferase involved in cell wall biosynthesis
MSPVKDQSMRQESSSLAVSIVIPIYNEERFLASALAKMRQELSSQNLSNYEVILIENGSTDRTHEVAVGLEKEFPQLKVLQTPKADYGLALRQGMLSARGKFIVNFDIDYWDILFLRKALAMLQFEYDIIIASKNALLSRDQRAMVRRIISQGYRFFLLIFFGLRVSDTHGIKAWRNDPELHSLIAETRFDKHIFDSELIIRSQKKRRNILEIPITVWEKRRSTRNILRRVPEAVYDLILLWWALRRKGKKK